MGCNEEKDTRRKKNDNLDEKKIEEGEINKLEKESQTSRTQNTEEIKKSNSNITKETLFLFDIEDKAFPEGEHYYQLVKDTNITDL